LNAILGLDCLGCALPGRRSADDAEDERVTVARGAMTATRPPVRRREMLALSDKLAAPAAVAGGGPRAGGTRTAVDSSPSAAALRGRQLEQARAAQSSDPPIDRLAAARQSTAEALRQATESVELGLGRIVALYHCSSTSYHIH
jgi:hypothetical protein